MANIAQGGMIIRDVKELISQSFFSPPILGNPRVSRVSSQRSHKTLFLENLTIVPNRIDPDSQVIRELTLEYQQELARKHPMVSRVEVAADLVYRRVPYVWGEEENFMGPYDPQVLNRARSFWDKIFF